MHHLVIAFTLAAAAAVANLTPSDPAAGPRISLVRNEFMLQCLDGNDIPVSFWNVEEAWNRSSPDAIYSCRVTRTQGIGVGTYSAEDQEAIKLVRQAGKRQNWTDDMVYDLLIKTCASWDSEVYSKTTPENIAAARAAIIVCPDAPFADELDEALDASVTFGSSRT
jgi:hypothetical protein